MSSAARAIAAANNGLLFDIGDMSTLYQDAEGTVPVTAVEQPVGKILDKSGNGNHATQSITASRPVLSARKNVLLATEALATQSVTSIATQYTLSFIGTGSVTLSGTATGTLTGTGTGNRVSLTVAPTAGTLTLTISGSVTKAQLELGAVAGPYQRVNTPTDYDTDPRYFPKYLRFDGVDDYLNLPYMGLYANGSASVISAADYKYSGTNAYILSEDNNSEPNQRYTPVRLIAKYLDAVVVNSAGVFDPDISGLPYVGSISSGVHAIIHTSTQMRIVKNSADEILEPFPHSVSLILNTTNIGARINGAGPTNMNLYGLIITKSALTDAQRIKCERFLAKKSGVML